MEGVLYKWTNYLTGWQPRWFVLDNGILSYYDSQDDVCKGSKGSIKMAVCEIKVHSADNTRMELIIPGEQHFYMKAVNAAERQRWLVALGSSKACLTDTRTKKEKEISETSESLKTKMSELRLYCDLLMKQVHTIQEFVHHDESHSSLSIENMNEASSLLSATCNTFITTLEECVKIANAKFKPEMFQLSHPDPLVSPVSPSPVQMVGTWGFSSNDIACSFVFVFIFRAGNWQWEGKSQQGEFLLTVLSFCMGASQLTGSVCARVLTPSPWKGYAIYPSIPGKYRTLGSCDIKDWGACFYLVKAPQEGDDLLTRG